MSTEINTELLQREIEAQRARVDETIDHLQARLSPGQLVDEVLAYTKDGGGAFVGNLGKTAAANPVPVALLGVSLAWLMSKPAPGPSKTVEDDPRGDTPPFDDHLYPVMPIKGDSLRRVGHSNDETGRRYVEFADEAGAKFRALSDAAGRRAGHFVDEAGNTYRGFTNAAGKEVQAFKDEAGALLEDASDWASHTWRSAIDAVQGTKAKVGAGASRVGDVASDVGRGAGEHARQINESIIAAFRNQPLVGGALAFAAGAAMAAALPRTEREDDLMGAASDQVKASLGKQAEEVYDAAKEQAQEVYEKITEHAAKTFEGIKSDFGNRTPPNSRL
ncbi:DUF3618 domain-containing protein [Bauldia litoralis]|uniref:Nutrient deprivation-induced protein n=1 Tax=Bauldia litoralis TaxID=665467 RepID=A0A1G6EMV8_9HYPH|nr:DUF3618 domain-containing protein [Bauldia litoralis]SDB58740.1 Protein of unknown function [Bauldia litoralis]